MGFVRRLPRISLVAAMVTTLITGALSGTTVSAAEATIYPSSRWDATTFTHEAGYPKVGTAAGRTVVAASMAVVAGATEFTGTITFDAVPDSSVVVEVGPSWLDEDGRCLPAALYDGKVPATGGPGITWSGATVSYTLPVFGGPMSAESIIECASIEVFGDVTDEDGYTSNEVVDMASAPMVPAPIFPTPTLDAPGSLKLVRGVPTPMYVTVSNPATSPTTLPRWVPVTGSAAGLKLTTATVDEELPPGESMTLRLVVTLEAKRAPAEITLTATPPEFTFSTTIATKAIKPPTPPKAGRYRGNGITFRVVAKGKKRWVTQIVGRPKENCIDDPINPPQRYRVPTNNIIDTETTDEILATYLVYNRVIMHFAGKRVTGYVDESYFDTSCVMGLDFKAKRVGP